MGKYDPLFHWLANLNLDEVRLSYQEIEGLIGELPRSAIEHREWWANEIAGTHVQARAWLEAGFAVEKVELGKGVTFKRTHPKSNRSTRSLKIYIFADMEGISGISRMEQVQPDNAAYPEACEWMMQDINNAIDAAFEAGATEVIACDTHGGGGQVKVAKMDPRATYETPSASLPMPSLDESFDGVILLGHHAKAGTLNGFLDHTESSASWFEYRINDQVVGEVGIEAAYAGHFGVPIIAVTGDEAVAREARELLGDVECAIVKWGVCRNRARCLSLPQAHKVIRETIHRAIKTSKSRKPWQPTLPVVEQLTLYRSDMADNLAVHPGVERVDARTLRRTVHSLKDICIW